MARCNQCGNTIVFGGVREGQRRYCGKPCRDKDVTRTTLDEIPLGFAAEKAWTVFDGSCPQCGGRGPIDVHRTYTVWSAAVLTQHNEKQVIGCASCGNKARLKAMLFCALFGWWGHGFFLAPVQIARNMYGLMTAGEATEPSTALVAAVREQLAEQLAAEDAATRWQPVRQAGIS
jgi:hypothetical protein